MSIHRRRKIVTLSRCCIIIISFRNTFLSDTVNKYSPDLAEEYSNDHSPSEVPPGNINED
jgi:hypothetical protein